jgi:O-antigen/teichoic acid export membrane protein
MSTIEANTPENQQAELANKVEIRTDSIAHGVALMLVLTVVQRSIGFARNVAVCRLLDPGELGIWNLAQSFLTLAAPLIILGVPGSYVRYVEHYRQRGQLRGFLRKTLLVTLVVGLVGVSLLLTFRDAVSWFAFGSREASELVVYTVATLVVVVAYNCGIELLTALRQIRANSSLQFINSLVFTIVSIGLLAFTTLGAKAVLLSYLVACAITTAGAVFLIRSTLSPLPMSEERLATTSIWQKIGPFIGWFWLSDLLNNLFNWIDRLMIVHYSGLSFKDSTALVGQYHSSRIIGVLLIAITCMLGSVLLSFLSHDWEAGRRKQAAARLDYALRLAGAAITMVAVVTLALAPIVFSWVLRDTYALGFSVLPVTMAYCVWYGLITVVANYIWCHEKPWLICFAVLFGIVVNTGLNYLLLPHWGLAGAVAATAIANLTILVCVCEICRRLGMQFRFGTIIALLLPGCLCLGPLPAMAISIATVWHGFSKQWLFDAKEIAQMRSQIQGYLRFFPGIGQRTITAT